MLVEVLLPLNFDQTFTYEIDQDIEIGQYVSVSFKNKEVIGVIWSINSKPLKKSIRIKKIQKNLPFHLYQKIK